MNFIQLVLEPIWRAIVISTTVAIATVNVAIGIKNNTPSPTPSPTPTVAITPTATPIPAGAPLIDCVGPDGKHLRVTQKTCKDFNNAWHPTVTPIPQTTISGTSSNPNTTGSTKCDVQGALCSSSPSTNYGTQPVIFTFP